MELTNSILTNRLFFLFAVSGIIFLLSTSGWVIGKIMSLIFKKNLAEVASTDKTGTAPAMNEAAKEGMKNDRISTGLIIGKCENLIIYLLTLTGEYTALAIIFTAKSIIRKEDMEKNSMFFLAGTMINVTYSLLVSIIFKLLIIIVLSSPVSSEAISSKSGCCNAGRCLNADTTRSLDLEVRKQAKDTAHIKYPVQRDSMPKKK
jgi:hypothetical protein